ncbi:MAG TPA: phosphoglycerate mutase family protein [Pyrinomonadaceae bacterium]|nr:phosphoglycerate mutase family protein [Pyrinomonadaceae bacterium]
MKRNQSYPFMCVPIGLISHNIPKRGAFVGIWRKQLTRLSLCLLGVLCVSAVAVGNLTNEPSGAISSHTALGTSSVNQTPTTVILVRHAEKAIVPPENKDPDISMAGLARAQELARMLGDSGIKAIYVTQFKRTQQTVKPLADKLGLTATQVQANKTADLVKQIREQNAGQTVFIAGHNNTVPEIIAALGGPTLPIIPETEFDNLYVLTVQGDGTAKLLKLKYGSPLPASGQGMMKQ